VTRWVVLAGILAIAAGLAVALALVASSRGTHEQPAPALRPHAAQGDYADEMRRLQRSKLVRKGR
jgi:hypothetical protein